MNATSLHMARTSYLLLCLIKVIGEGNNLIVLSKRSAVGSSYVHLSGKLPFAHKTSRYYQERFEAAEEESRESSTCRTLATVNHSPIAFAGTR